MLLFQETTLQENTFFLQEWLSSRHLSFKTYSGYTLTLWDKEWPRLIKYRWVNNGWDSSGRAAGSQSLPI